jgi:hypothetical protein
MRKVIGYTFGIPLLLFVLGSKLIDYIIKAVDEVLDSWSEV